MSYCPLAFRLSIVFPVLSHSLASNKRISMKFKNGKDVMMHVKIYKDVIGCMEVIAL